MWGMAQGLDELAHNCLAPDLDLALEWGEFELILGLGWSENLRLFRLFGVSFGRECLVRV